MAGKAAWGRVRTVSTPAPSATATARANQATARHELFFFNYFRLGQAAVYTALAFRPEHMAWPALPDPVLARGMALAYLFAALVMVARTRTMLHRPVLAVSIGLVLDIAAAVLALILMHDVRMGVAMMLAVNIATGALLLPLRLSMFFAAVATLAMLGHSLFDVDQPGSSDRELVEYGLFGAAYFACASLCYVLGRNIRATEALAEQRGIDLANLSQVNELIIRRLKTGVLLVDEGNRIHQLNESAWMLMGNPAADQRDLGSLAPELSRRLYHWRTSGKLDESATMLADGTPEVVPRFSRLAPNDDSHVLIFLDDTSLVSRRAEELTLSSLGRLSASIAHEIRNPLAAIHYSAQLLAESTELADTDVRMVEIINNHCVRLNEIIENILQLSRRERSRPETLDLGRWVHDFVSEYRQGNDLGADILRAVSGSEPVAAVADPQHLQQVIWNLVQNALRYGRMPSEPARVMVVARHSEAGVPILEVIDRGPGIAPKVAAQIFEPFFTTHEYGTGLGLYLARQMTEANQAALEYVRVAGGGSCFRISLTPPARTPAAAPVAARA
ncbi:histidine kinase [Luteibacter yeojuensis]|uniref:histidine kinase n=1 Tax=Luteibacter yeojuensis TaxID=345309 RepID=A0A0F3KD30_9GAMM|nr:histidine kinase [Luteibacter yeojuensis]